MEAADSKTENEELKKPAKSKRRISSILKAPRTPLKSIAADNEDCQEETGKTTEKKRNSRRVSFASTNDIHVFIKDFKNGSSLENLLQDLSGTGEETLDNTGIHAVKEGEQQIFGMDTLLNAPLHASQHPNKENIFTYGGQTDNTVVFSEEDTAFMNMTHCHTIIIDNKADETDTTMSGCGNLDLTAFVGGGKTTGFGNSRREVPESTSGKGPIGESEMADFLASLTRSNGSGRLSSNIKAPSPAPKVDSKKFLARLHANRSAVDQENQVPVAIKKSKHQDGSSQSRSHPLNDRTIISVDKENVDLTKTHTAIQSDEELFTHKTFASSEEQEDMEMTKCQTVVIDSKTCHVVNSSNSITRGLSMLAPNKTILYSEADHDMEMTGHFTGCIVENLNPSAKHDEMARWSFPATNRISRSDGMDKRYEQIDTNARDSLWPAASYDPEDIEMTRSQTVVIESKHRLTPSLGKPRSASCILAPNKTVMFSEVDHDMDMTDAFTGHLEVNERSSAQSNEGSGCLFPAKNTICHAGQNEFAERSSSPINAKAWNNGLCPATPSNSDNMEMTRCQTVVIDSKNYPMNPSLIKPRSMSCMLSPNKTVMFSEADHDMEMTDAYTGHLDVNKHYSHRGDETTVSSFPATNTISGQKDFFKRRVSQMDAHVSNQSFGPPTQSNPDDMEMTRNHTVVIDSKHYTMKNLSLNKVISGSCMSAQNKTIMYSDDDQDMEMTDVFTENIKESWNLSTKKNETTSRIFSNTNSVVHTNHNNDMDLTSSQTVVIDSKNCPIYPLSVKDRRLSCISAQNKTIMFSDVDHDMEMTNAFTGHIEENRNPSTERHEAVGWTYPATNTVALNGQMDGMKKTGSQLRSNALNTSSYCSSSPNADDMDVTKCQTVVIESKNCPTNPSFGEVSQVPSLSPPRKTIMFSETAHDMEMTDTLGGHTAETTCARTGRSSGSQKKCESSGVSDAVSSDPNDMEMTRCQTVVIDSKYCGTAKAPLSIVRKSLSSVLPTSKALGFPKDYCGMQVPKALIGLDMAGKKFPASVCGTTAKLSPTEKINASEEPEATGRAQCQTTACDPDSMEIRSEVEPQHGVMLNPLPVTAKIDVHCESDSSKPQMSEDKNGIEMPNDLAGLTATSGHPPIDGLEAEMKFFTDLDKSTQVSILQTSASNSTWDAVASKGMENEHAQNVHIKTRNGEVANALTCIMSKGSQSESSYADFLSETNSGFVAENTHVPADGVVCLLPNTRMESVPPQCLPNCQTVPEGNTRQCDQIEGPTLQLAGSSILSEMSYNTPLMNYTATADEGKSHTTNGHKRDKSHRMSLADLQSRLQNIGNKMTEKFDLEKGYHTAPIPWLSTPSSPKVKEADCIPTEQPGIDDHAQAGNSKLNGQTNRTEVFNLSKTKPWTARLSFGGFLPKLPQRSKPLDLNPEEPTGHCDISMLQRESKVCVAEEDRSCGEVKNINEETLPEISSEEDLSETVEGTILRDREQEANGSQAVVDAEPIQNVSQGQKRPFPVDGHECYMPEERKMRSLTISSHKPEPSTNAVQWDGTALDVVVENPPSFMTRTLDSTCSPNQRCEGTLEMSAHRSSQCDIQFDEPYKIQFQQKLEDGSITTREFLKLFGIDFNILRPRQSVLPENFETDSPTNTAVLMDKHINRPKQRVYEEDCQELAEMVEKLKTRMRDQEKSLKTTNEALWDVVKTYSEEQLQNFGTKLKERKVYFRKKSKSLSHELKIGLYSKLVHTTQAAQQNLTEKIDDMDELLKHLDECVNDLHVELSSLDCAGVEDDNENSESKLNLEVKQQELESLRMSLADNERRVCELELEKNSARGKVKKLQEETMELEKQINILDRLTEWKLSEKTEDRAVFAFLYGSMCLEVLFEKPADEAVTAAETEQNVADITFQLELDEENSQCYALLVHNLLRQFIQDESSWVQKYPTSRHIPRLLHDVSVVVSRCRLLGEEIHRLQKSGALRLDILEIGCVETQVRILFSSLKAFAKFELTLAITPSYPLADLQLIHFQTYIGNTTVDQVEEIISAETPQDDYLSRVVKRIHNDLLC